MKITRRSRLWLLIGAIAATFTVVLWSTYIFTAIWLRVQCARELAAKAEPLEEISLSAADGTNPDTGDSTSLRTVTMMFQNMAGLSSDSVLSRLEELQHPSIPVVLRQLMGQSSGASQVELQSPQATWAGSVAGPGVTVTASTSSGQSGGAQASGSITLTLGGQSGSIASGQTLSRLTLWDFVRSLQCHSVTDTRGDTLLLVMRRVAIETPDGQTGMTESRWELLIVDSSGRIISRSPAPGPRLVGKLQDRLDKADQLVFENDAPDQGAAWIAPNDTQGTNRTICVIENGQLKTVRSLRTLHPATKAADESPPND